jgi:DNA-binding response OmpR family regulator
MARHMGASEVLSKPFSGTQLMGAITRLLPAQKA